MPGRFCLTRGGNARTVRAKEGSDGFAFSYNSARTIALRRFLFPMASPSRNGGGLAREDEWPSGMDRMGMIFTRLVGMLPATVHWKLPSGIEE